MKVKLVLVLGCPADSPLLHASPVFVPHHSLCVYVCVQSCKVCGRGCCLNRRAKGTSHANVQPFRWSRAAQTGVAHLAALQQSGSPHGIPHIPARVFQRRIVCSDTRRFSPSNIMCSAFNLLLLVQDRLSQRSIRHNNAEVTKCSKVRSQD